MKRFGSSSCIFEHGQLEQLQTSRSPSAVRRRIKQTGPVWSPDQYSLWKATRTPCVKLEEFPFDMAKRDRLTTFPFPISLRVGSVELLWFSPTFTRKLAMESLDFDIVIPEPLSLRFRCQASSPRWLADNLIEMAQYFRANPPSSQLRLFFTCVRSVIVVEDGRHAARRSASTLSRIRSDHRESCRSPLFSGMSVDFAGACARPRLQIGVCS